MSRVLMNGAGGRIGRAVTHEMVTFTKDPAQSHNSAYLIAINEPRGLDFVVNDYKSRDPVHGVYDWKVKKLSDKTLLLDGIPVSFFAEKDISKVPFTENGIDLVIECSGFFGDPKVKDNTAELKPEDNGARAFLGYGVERVIQTYPAKTADIMMVMGVNHGRYNPAKHKVISNASCTTKALAMPLQVLIDNGVNVHALSMDTTHAETGDDLSRLAGLLDKTNLESTPREEIEKIFRMTTHSTGAARATGYVISSLEGKMNGMSYRVPTLDGSFANLYLVASADNELSAEGINNMFREAVSNPAYMGRIGVFEGKDAGTFDIVGREENAVVIPSKTNLIQLPFSPKGKKAYLVTVISGYDNEIGSSKDPFLAARYVSDNL